MTWSLRIQCLETGIALEKQFYYEIKNKRPQMWNQRRGAHEPIENALYKTQHRNPMAPQERSHMDSSHTAATAPEVLVGKGRYGRGLAPSHWVPTVTQQRWFEGFYIKKMGSIACRGPGMSLRMLPSCPQHCSGAWIR